VTLDPQEATGQGTMTNMGVGIFGHTTPRCCPDVHQWGTQKLNWPDSYYLNGVCTFLHETCCVR